MPLFLLFSIASSPLILYCRTRSAFLLTMFTLASFQLFSTIWAIDPALGVRSFLYALPLLVILTVAAHVRSNDPSRFRAACALYASVSLLHSLSCIVFRAFPAAEAAFLSSTIADILINPNTKADLFTILRNNVLDPAKSAGFLVNGNVAAAWCALSGYLAISLADLRKTRLNWLVVASVHFGAAIATGSKAAVFLMFVSAAAGWLTWQIAGRRVSALSMLGAVLTPPVIITVALSLHHFLDTGQLVEDSGRALGQRQLIWGRAWQAFLESPWLGQGYGGWSRDFMAFGAAAKEAGLGIGNFPAHNTFIILWSESGIVAVIIGIAAIVAGYRDSLLGAKSHAKLASSCAVAGWSWMVLHGLGENFGLFGDPHMQGPLALLLAGSIGAATANERSLS